ncbi:MAG: penicillin amidase [Acidimicrobiales bacterium]|jgi:penicillin G amidase
MGITITRDNWGIGHAACGSASDAFWAQGWMAASDRIWQMEWDRRKGLGQWAEVVGTPGIDADRFFRRLGLSQVAQADWQALRPETKHMTEAYAEGVNAWLAAHPDDLPAEFDTHPGPPAPWEPWHCIMVYKVRHLFMGTFLRKLWRGAVLHTAGPEAAAAMRGDPQQATPMVPGPGVLPSPDLLGDALEVLRSSASDLAAVADTDGGSNSWAVHGSRTASGLPLLAGDPHRGIEFPNVYYQCHITSPEFDVIGLAFPGVPGFPHFGHNAAVAWCITHGMADDTDVFVETDLSDVDWRTESIAVAGDGAGDGGGTVEVVCGSTPRGPIVLGEPDGEGAVLSMMWTGISGIDTTLDALHPMLVSTSCSELEEAVRPWVIPVNNLLTADVGGDISLKIRGRVIERSTASRWTPIKGSDENSWARREPVPFDQLPAWRNPDRGFLVTANNRIADAGPYISLDFAGPARHDRIVQLLEQMPQATPADMPTIHSDVLSLVAGRVCDRLLRAKPATELGRSALGLLAVWDHQLSADSAAACLYSSARRSWSDLVAERLGVAQPSFGGAGWPDRVASSRMMHEAATALLLNDTWNVVPGIDSDEDLARVLAESIDAAAAELAKKMGPDPAAWRWDEIHVMVSPHPLASVVETQAALHPPVDGCAGDGDTVRAGAVAPLYGDRSHFASVGRYVFDPSDWDQSGWVVPHGVSGERGSGHDLDQRPSWLACELIPMSYTPAAIANVASSSVELERC